MAFTKCVKCGRPMEIDLEESRLAFYCHVCQVLDPDPRRRKKEELPEKPSKPRIIQV